MTERRSSPVAAPLYAIADRAALDTVDPADAVEEIAQQGIGWIQLRAKPAPSDRELFRLAEECCRRLEGSNAKFWIDDRVDLAATLPTAGVHVGQQDLPPAAARTVLGGKGWVGYSTHATEQVDEAHDDPYVDVVALGPIFATTGKNDPDPVVGLDALREARERTSKPLVAIGGIDADNVAEVLAAGADSAAILGAVCRGGDLAAVRRNCRRLIAAVEGVV